MTDVSSRSIRVLLVDDHPALREGTAELMAHERDLEVVGAIGTLDEARAALAGSGIDVLVLDIRLQGERGLELLAELEGRPGAPAVVIWTAYDLPQYAAYAFRRGASGFVVKTAPTLELIQAVRQAAAGAVRFDPRPDLTVRELTSREHTLLSHLVAGLSNDEIATAMGVTTRTVEARLTRLYERFDIHSRAELVARVVGEGWLDVPPA
jgi:DNA-binding NarL/FixJ family response regulator